MSEAEKQLREHQQQLDCDGVMVGVSRQALEEFMAEKKALREHNDRLIRINHSEGVENQRLREENQDLRLQLITELVPDGYKEQGEK